jgi:predicted O-methyltransferase YrrM
MRHQVREQGYYEAGHYYSPIPSRSEVAANLAQNRAPSPPAGVDLQRDSQLALLKSMASYYGDLPFPEKQGNGCRYYFDQIWFGHSDAIMLYGLIRHFKIKRIIEVGSGYSSAVMLDTLERFGDGNFDLTCVEPYPDRLKSLIAVNERPNVKLIEKKIQEVPLDIFDSLREGDLLFVDSSHVMKYKSDLHRILFEVLPRLHKGVIVHFHDIFYPFEYPEEWLGGGRYWNECYLLHAFLSGNRDWEIVLFNHYANLEFADFIESAMPLCRKNFGGSFYIRKVK